MALNVSIVVNPKLAGVALIVGVSLWGIGYIISTVKGNSILISKDGYYAHTKKETNND